MSQVSKLSSMDPKGIQSVVESIPQNFYKISGKFLILPEMSSTEDYREVASKISGKVEFKGNFKFLTDFGEYSTRDTVSFCLLEKGTPVGQMKRQISDLTGVPAEEIQISFHNVRPLRDDILFCSDLNCHGKGGENFWLTRSCSEVRRAG